MPTTENVGATLKWALSFIKYQPLTIGGDEPALSNADTVLKTILGPPFGWPWNRSTAILNLTLAAGQDYKINVPDFGFLEGASIIDPTTSKPMELTIRTQLQLDANEERPQYVAAQLDDGAGNITFRVVPSPDKAYIVVLTFQRKAPTITSLASYWAPVPDQFMYIPRWGFLALGCLIVNDARFPVFNAKFVAHLLSAQGGVDELQRNIFIQNWLQVTTNAQAAQLATQQRSQARAQ